MERAGDGDVAFFERLSQHFEAPAIELRQLVQKQDAVVRQGVRKSPHATGDHWRPI
jgi:hypothetical protein